MKVAPAFLAVCLLSPLAALDTSCQRNLNEPTVSEARAAAEENMPPVAVIEGPETARVGALVLLTASKSHADYIGWDVDVSGVHIPNGIDKARFEEAEAYMERMGFEVIKPSGDQIFYAVRGKELFLSSYPGVYRVTLGAAVDGEGIDLAGHLVTIGDPPDTGPTPPVPPPSGFGLSLQAAGWVDTVPAAQESVIADVARVFADIAALADNGKFNTLAEMDSATSAAIKATIKGSSAEWATFGGKFVAAINDLKSAGKIKTPQDQAKAYREISEGMK